MNPEQRRERIVALTLQRERVAVDELAAALKSSRETIRRDLSELDRRGRLRKIHGGATIAESALVEPGSESPFQMRLGENIAAKRAIARRAAPLFQPGETLFVDTGSTTILFAEEIAHATGLTVVTNSAAIAAFAGRGPESSVFLIGGAYRNDGAESVGPLAVEQIARFHADHAVLTVGAIGEVGLLDYDLEEALVARAMIAHARSVTVLADSSKFGHSALFKVAPLGAVDRIVTERSPVQALETTIAAAGIDLILSS
ncbi:DeoR/GlpR family DNA-binding transcription regulator [Hansschlegelia quercus]|uniref:DeoR/GlpR transcriptional regulator n=1 Tax=Hansschlegelia quercus TaxID=2528245 RepID=A0A4Q9GG55_9HYPH|nr:DeoR/GlpR family DNA-binding transcription regulator [Hansschlegelia quercus]TBN52462.1 DeoR/GlpR transcriptional regulator [Hansschlegelia quercus]